jgi:hypothetical protein
MQSLLQNAGAPAAPAVLVGTTHALGNSAQQFLVKYFDLANYEFFRVRQASHCVSLSPLAPHQHRSPPLPTQVKCREYVYMRLTSTEDEDAQLLIEVEDTCPEGLRSFLTGKMAWDQDLQGLDSFWRSVLHMSLESAMLTGS